MLRLTALRIPPRPRWAVQRTSMAFMSKLPGLPAGTSLSWPARPDSVDTASSPGLPPLDDLPNFFQDAVADIHAEDAEDSGPPTGPSTAYPPPDPSKTNPISGSVHNINLRLAHQALPHYGLYVKATRNNTITTITTPSGNPISTFSGGICGFKGQRRSSYEAGFQCAMKAIKALEVEKDRVPRMRVNLFLNGFGQGRDAMYKALSAAEGQIVRFMVTQITDKTPVKIGGTRAKKRRRA